MNFTTIDRILAGLHRDLRGTDLNESDIIEWTGEALGFLNSYAAQEQAIAFIKIENYEGEIPDGFRMVLQIARYNKDVEEVCERAKKVEEIDTEKIDFTSIQDCADNYIVDWMLGQLTPYQPYFDMQWQYIEWTSSNYYAECFTPVRLSNNSLFNSIVCKERELYQKPCGRDEYNIVGLVEKKIRVSFKEGYIALAYSRTPVDKETGYPLIPDDIRHISAIRYYIRWKIAEHLDWSGREGFANRAETNRQLWNKYVKQANNYSKMPKTVDELQNLLEASHYLIPQQDLYYGYFGKLGSPENRNFNRSQRRR